MSEYLTLEEIAAHYRRTIKSVRRWRERGIGPRAVKVGGRLLFLRTEVERYDREIQAQLDGAADPAGVSA